MSSGPSATPNEEPVPTPEVGDYVEVVQSVSGGGKSLDLRIGSLANGKANLVENGKGGYFMGTDTVMTVSISDLVFIETTGHAEEASQFRVIMAA